MRGPITTRSLLACRDTLAAGLIQRRAGMRPEAPDGSVDLDGLPPGIVVAVSVGHDPEMTALDPVPLDLLHAEAVQMAWRDGAWDIRCHVLPPLAGTELMLVASARCADRTLVDRLVQAAERGALVHWMWRPLRDGPAIRRGAHAAKDRTLDAAGGRAGAAPPAALAIRWRWRSWRDRTIRLGDWSDAHRPAPKAPPRGPEARATGQQRGYIVDLRRRLGRAGEPLPAALTRRQASAIIDDLLGPTAP